MTHNNNDRRAPSRLRARLRQSRYDTRGIALQTIIIMVVLLAIAGAVAVVLFNRASEETDRLEATKSVEFYGITNKTICTTSGYEWKGAAPPAAPNADRAALVAAGRTVPAANAAFGWCDPTK